MVKKRLASIILFSMICLSANALFATSSASAIFNLNGCSTAAWEYDPSGVMNSVCNRISDSPSSCNNVINASVYGAIYLSEFNLGEGNNREWDGLAGGKVDGVLKRRVYSCGIARGRSADAIEIDLKNNPIIKLATSKDYILAYEGTTTFSWSDESTDSTPVKINLDELKKVTASGIDNNSDPYRNGVSVTYSRRLRLNGDKKDTGVDTAVIDYYKIANLEGDTKVAKVEGAKLNRNDGKYYVDNLEGKVTVTFEHTINRNDGWSNENVTSNSVKYCMLHNNSTSCTYDNTPSTNGFTKTNPIKISDDKIEETFTKKGEKQICSAIAFPAIVGIGGYDLMSRDATRTIARKTTNKTCVTIVETRTILYADSKSAINVNGNIAEAISEDSTKKSVSATIRGSSSQKDYTFTFYHYLKLKDDESEKGNIAYTISRKVDNGSYVEIETGELKNLVAKNKYELVMQDAHSETIAKYGGKVTVCEKIEFHPKNITIKLGTTVGSSGSDYSEICATVTRGKPASGVIEGKTTAIADRNGVELTGTDNTTPTMNVGSRNVTFSHKLWHCLKDASSNCESLSVGTIVTAYHETFRNGVSEGVKTNSKIISKDITVTKTPTKPALSDSVPVSIGDGESVKVCGWLHYDPSSFTKHTDGSIETKSNTPKDTEKVCVTFKKPGPTEVNDGLVTIIGTSIAKIDEDSANRAGQQNGMDLYLLKGKTAKITYEHVLSRSDVRHANDVGNTATGTVETRYRLSEISETGAIDNPSGINFEREGKSTTVKNNSTTSPAFTDSVKSSEIKLGEYKNYCQSIYFKSSTFDVYGKYYLIDNAFVDNKLIQNSERLEPKGTIGNSTPACVRVTRPYNFKIDSISLSVDDSEDTAAGQTFETDSTINVKKNNSDYQITDISDAEIKMIGFVVSGGIPASLAGGKNISDACAHFRSQMSGATMDSCEVIKTETDRKISKNGVGDNKNATYYTVSSYSASYSYSPTLPDLPKGSNYCVALMAKPSDSGTGLRGGFTQSWVLSNAECKYPANHPTVQIWGGSTFTNGGIKTGKISNPNTNPKTILGSWTDYLVISNRTNKEMASGAAFIAGLSEDLHSDRKCVQGILTVSNKSCRLGNANIHSDSDLFVQGIRDRYMTDSTTANVIRTDTVNSSIISGSLTPLIIYNTGDINITNNITLPSGPYLDAKVPQIIIFADGGNINIAPEVEKIDAWLLSNRGTILTCANASGALASGDKRSPEPCERTLKINGPVFTNKILFDRTAYGEVHEDASQDTSKLPAEIIDFNPSAFLFGASESENGNQPITKNLQKLPPRY